MSLDREQLAEVVRTEAAKYPAGSDLRAGCLAIADAVLTLVQPEIERMEDELNCAVAERKQALAERDRLRERVAALEGSRRIPELDNHHNALACGYCSGPLKEQVRVLREGAQPLVGALHSKGPGHGTCLFCRTAGGAHVEDCYVGILVGALARTAETDSPTLHEAIPLRSAPARDQ